MPFQISAVPTRFSRAVLRLLAMILTLAVLTGQARAETTFTLNYAFGIANGMRLCDSSVAPSYCVDITRDPASSPAAPSDFTLGASPRISGSSVAGGATAEAVILNYDTSNSPTPFTLDLMNISNIESLTPADAGGGVRDAYAWAEPGQWSILGTGGAASPAGAIVSVDRANSFGGIGNYVGDFVIADPDVFNGTDFFGNPIPCSPPNEINQIQQFNALVQREPAQSSDVLLNMCGPLDGHNVSFEFATPATSAKLYAFNAGPNAMRWGFVPSTTVTLRDPRITLRTVVDNSAGGTATASDFLLSFDNGAGTSGSGVSGDAAITNVTVASGSYTLTSGNLANYTTSLSCAGALDTNPDDGLTLQDGDGAVCTFTKTYVAPPPSLSPFATGPGLAASQCGATTPATAWEDYAINWHNNGGTNIDIARPDIFASAVVQAPRNISTAIVNTVTEIDRATVTATFDASKSFEYSFTTTNFPDIAEIWGIGVGAYDDANGTYADESGAFRFSVIIDEDPAFGSPQVILTEGQIDSVTFPGAQAIETQDTGWNIYGFGHFDADGTVVQLAPSTTYYIRVNIYGDTRSGMHWGQFASEIVMWDDFTLKTKTCPVPVIDAVDDSLVALQTDSSAGSVYANDTLSATPVTQANVTSSVLVPALPASLGAPVPYLETAGAQEGEILVPAGTPAGVYSIEYQLCSTADPLNCDTATATIVLQVSPPTAPLTCTPGNVFAAPRTQLAGPGSAAAVHPDDIYLFDNVASDINGNPIDVVFQLNTVSGPVNMRFNDTWNTLDADMRAVDNSWLSFDVTMVRDGTATPATPQGTPIDLSRVNGVIIQQVDIDSYGVNHDSSDVGGFLTGSPDVSYFNTVPWPAFPAPGQAIVMDPAKTGTSANWFDEPNQSDFDNYATYRYEALNTGTFLLGFTGSETNLATRGAGILLCTIADTSASLVATDDDYGASPVNGGLGGVAGNVLDNDTVDLSLIDPVLASITTIAPATPVSLGDPVPYIETDGALEGQVVVPLFTPAGTYTIVYELCETIDPSNCDRATVTVAVDPALIDRGDAPASYGEAAHLIVPQIFLGADLPDSEASASYSADATGDDSAGIDDEDGLALIPDFIAGETAELTVSVRESLNFDPLPPLFGVTYLNLWIDFDGNGSFGAGEQVAVDVVNGGPFDLDGGFDTEIRLAVPVPADAVAGPTIARLRWSTTAGLVSDDLLGFALDGEVEDHEVTIFTTPPEADLSLTKTVQDTAGAPLTEALAGTALDFVLTLSNDGPGAPDGVVVSDLLPSGYAYVSDDAAAQGMSYDAATGLWQVGSVPAGESRSLTIRSTLLAAGNHLNRAEIIASSLIDPDSDPAVGPVTDDLGDGIADDDEASAGMSVLPGAATLSGTIFLDNGAGGGVAHDGTRDGTEAGSQAAIMTIRDGAGTDLGTASPDAEGQWSFTLPAGYTGAITVLAEATGDHVLISETQSALPGRVLPDPLDGALSFTSDPATDQTGLDFGLIREASLTEGQEATISAGQIVQLRHEYLAHSAGEVTFSVADVSQQPANAFSATIYSDPACDGTPGLPITASVTVTADTRICLLVRVSADQGIGDGAVYAYDLIAETAYTGTALSETDTNTDRVSSQGGATRLELSKTVENITAGSGAGSQNAASIGDVLEYRIYLRNTSTSFARDVIIYDQTPAYTRLSAPVASPVSVGIDLVCSLAEPATNAAGYAGPLRWECTGGYAPGETGFVQFRVEIAP